MQVDFSRRISRFWTNLAVQSLATLWLMQLTLRVLSVMQTFRFVAISLILLLSTALPWLASMLLTDIFAGLSVLSLFLLVIGGRRTSALEKIALFVFTAFAAATHSATLGVLLGLQCAAGWMARPLLGPRLPLAGLTQASLTIVAGGLLLMSARSCAVRQMDLDTRRLRRRLRPHDAGRHRCALSQRPLSARKLQALPVSQRVAGERRRVPVGQEHVQHARPLLKA